jgi:adenylate cyclase
MRSVAAVRHWTADSIITPGGRSVAMTAATACRTCGTEPLDNARFCHGCGSPLTESSTHAEHKQVTVLFADVVHSMDIAAAVGAERLREIMADVADRCAAVVQRYGGTVDKFTGDGIMAVFGAPMALEDHAIRACLAALGVQEEAIRLDAEVRYRDGIDLRLRVGLNSGQVIAGEIGSGSFGYTAVGEQVGMAQRMESVAPPGAVMLSASTARLVDGAAALGEPEMVRIKGADKPVAAYRLLGTGDRHRAGGRAESNLVGRRWEMSAVQGLLGRAFDGHGAVVGVVGPPGIGKSRLAREIAATARRRGVETFTVFCESHTSQVPFHAVARLLRATTGVVGLDPQAARVRIRAEASDAEAEDLLLFDDLLGVGDPDAVLPQIDPDARRRRLTALVNATSLARESAAVYVVEDAHWIDEVSESMLADFLSVIPQAPLLVLITYRPEYEGALTRVHGAQTIALAPLTDSDTAALVADLLGPDRSVVALGRTIADRATGNPFFAEEIVRELADRGVLEGKPGAYLSTAEVAEVSVPATLQATIAARIDRLDPKAKRTLSAAAVIGSRFGLDLLTALGIEPVVDDLVAAELVDQVKFTRQAEYVFHHPLIRAVAYEAQLKSDRADLHRRVAAAIESRYPASVEENAALIGEHLEAAGDLHAAYDWHMRAGGWSTNRDITAARMSWQRACQVADRLPADDPARTSMRIAPRTLLCGTTWRVSLRVADTGFDELRDLAAAAGDRVSLAIGMAGLLQAQALHDRPREASALASEYTELVESIGDPTLILGLSVAAMTAKYYAGEMAETLRLSQRAIDMAEGDPTKGNLIVGSPLAWAFDGRAGARWALGLAGWRSDFDQAITMAGAVDPVLQVILIADYYTLALMNGALLPDATALRDTAEALAIAEESGDDSALFMARGARGIVLVHQHGPEREHGFDLLAQVREAALQAPVIAATPVVDIRTAEERLRSGDLVGAIDLSRAVIDYLFAVGEMIYRGPATTVLVETLLRRNAPGDLQEARAAIDRLTAVPTEPGFVLHQLPLLRLRALLARAQGDETGYCDYRDRYRAMANDLGFEGHMAIAETMP